MAQSGTSPTQFLAVGVISFAAWQVFKSGGFKGFGITPGGTAAPIAKSPNTGPTPVASGTVQPVPATVSLTLSNQYNELHDDGWYQVNQWSDGSYTFTYIAPSRYADYGIPSDGPMPVAAAAGPAGSGSTSFTGGIPYPAQAFYAPGGGGQNAPITPVVNWMLGVWNSLTGQPQ